MGFTFYQCYQEPERWDKIHCQAVAYKDIGFQKGNPLVTQIVPVPSLVPTVLHPLYLTMTLHPVVTTQTKMRGMRAEGE